MKKILVIFLLIISLCGCVTKKESYQYTSDKEVESLMLNNDFIIIDVRTKEEYDAGHIKDAINIPYDEINENTILDKNSLIFVYCRSGNRSKIAYDKLISYGYQVYDLGAMSNVDLPKE